LKASVTEHLGWWATVTTTEAVAGSIKAEQRRPQGGEKKAKQRDGEAGNERKNWERQRIETHKTGTNTSSKPRKPVLIFSSSIAPLQAKKKKNPSSKL
jgi:hypothetical protein